MKDGADAPGRRRPSIEASDRDVHVRGPAPRSATLPAPESAPVSALPIVSFLADEVALAAASHRAHGRNVVGATSDGEVVRCDACDAAIEGEAAGKGLYMWSRGGELRWDEPALCEDCATAIVVTAQRSWDVEEEEG